MDDLDFSKPAGPQRTAPPPPKSVYDPAMALEFFRAGGKPEAVPAGTRFFEENEKAGFLRRDKVYLLIEGDVALSANGKPLGAVKAGEIFGEMAAVSDSPRTATATARTACRVIALDEREFQKALQAKPEFAVMLLGMMVERLRAMLARLGARGAAPAADREERDSRVFDKSMLSALAKGLGAQATVRHNAGTVLFREGSVGTLAYVVLEGRVSVTIQGRPVQKVGPGGIFGEMALLDQSTRTASATAETDVALIAINRAVFLALVRKNPEFGAALLGAVAGRVRFVAERAR